MDYSTMGFIDNTKYVFNMDLQPGQSYLRKLVEKYAWQKARIKKGDLERRYVLTYDNATATATVTLNGKINKYSVQLGNAIGKNGRLIVNIQEFNNYFFPSSVEPITEASFLDKVANWFTYDSSAIAGPYGYLNVVGQNSPEATQFFRDYSDEWLYGGYSDEKMEEARVTLFRQGILKSDPFYEILLQAQMEYWKEYDNPTWSKAIATAIGLGVGEVIRGVITNVIARRILYKNAPYPLRFSGGNRQPTYRILTQEEIGMVKREFIAIGGDVNKLRFNEGQATGYSDVLDIIYIKGDILPLDGVDHPRSIMSIRAVLAHEMYGHAAYRGTSLGAGLWNDEFRASYMAAKNTPNLSQLDKYYLIQDAILRAQEANIPINFNDLMKNILYGY
jgi:hypothetical protein